MTGQSRSKSISVSLLIDDIKNDSFFFQLADDASNNEILRQRVFEKYPAKTGVMESYVENDRLVVQWIPEDVDYAAETLHQEAIELAKVKKYDRAIEKWKHAVELNPKDADYLYKIGLVYFELKKYNEAIEYLDKTVQLCPIHAKACLLLGISYIKTRQLEKAEKFICHSNRLNRSNILPYLNLGAIYSVQKRYNDAVEMFNMALQLSPREIRALLGLARVHQILNDTEAANTYYQKVIEISPDSKAAQFARKSIQKPKTKEAPIQITEIKRKESIAQGMNAYLSGHYTESVSSFKNYVKIQPTDDVGWYLLGEAQIRNSHLDEAADCFKRAIKNNNKRSLYYKSLGITFHLLGKTHETIEVLKKAIDLGKQDPLTRTIYGISLMQIKKYAEGIKELNGAIQKDPNNPMAMYHLALAQIKSDNRTEAKRLLEKIITFEVFTPFKQQAEKLLNEIKY